jgi:glycosyltransferase involved in cell wall biosynthesis
LNLNGNECKRNILFVGRLQDFKGIDLLLNAFSQLRTLGYQKELNLTLVGTTHPSITQEDLSYMIEKNNLKDNIYFLNHLPNENVIKLINNSLVVVVPSYWESFGMVGLEVVMQNKKLVHSNVGLFHDFPNLFPNTFIFESGDLNSLVIALERALVSSEKHDTLSSSDKILQLKNLFSLQKHLQFFTDIVA